MKDIAKLLGITRDGIEKNGKVIYDLEGSNEFGKVYSSLETNEDAIQEEDTTLLNVHSGSLSYVFKDTYKVNMVADFDNDLYKVIISEF